MPEHARLQGEMMGAWYGSLVASGQGITRECCAIAARGKGEAAAKFPVHDPPGVVTPAEGGPRVLGLGADARDDGEAGVSRNSQDEQAVADALGVSEADVGLGPRAEEVRPVDAEHPDGPCRWQAVGPRGVREGVAESRRAAWDAAGSAPVGRRSLREDKAMPEYVPLWRKYG